MYKHTNAENQIFHKNLRQQINERCMAHSVDQREKIISCIENSNYCELYNADQIEDATKIAIDCDKKTKL